ncbi:MAG TPA: transglycosylase domain-containing protein, partial [Candidatus Dojkabacteria bacterium]|nr:transglycosylase domain-containing protein [Candidatus Dojkabacteria bacterium]
MDYKSKSSKSFKTKVTGKSTSSAMRGGYKNYRKISKKRKYAPYGSNNKTGFIARLTHNPNLKKAIIALISAFAFIGVILIFGVTVYLKNISDKIPSPDTLLEREFEESTKIYDRNGVLLYTTYGDQNRQYITIDKLPSHTKWALLAAEDVDFYKHNGVDWPGVVMAGVEMIKRRDTSGRGSSTISQQLVRNTVLVDILGEEAYKKAVSRKIQEMLITLNFEQELTKDQILEYYINVIPLGGVVYGYQTGAEIYFGKDISELTLAESAILAGIIQAPGYYSPLFGIEPTKADIRKNYVLDQLENNLDYINNELSKEGKEPITHEDIENARNEEIIYKSKPLDIKAPHFVFYVLDELNEKYGEEYVKRGGLNVTTTLDYDLFQIGNDEIHKLYESEKAQTQYNVHNAAMVAIDPRSGEILVMIGSYDYFAQDDPRVDGNVNVADSLRQMGSSVKPIGYLTSFTQGYYPTLLTPDIPMEFGNYKLKNWDGKFQNHRLLRDALLHSRNIPAVYITQLTGVDAWIETAEKLGVTSLTDRSNFGLSIAVGAAEIKLIELTQAYTVFATGGIKREAEAILKITDRKGEIIYEINKEREERVFSEQEIYLLNWVLCNDSGASRLGSNYFKVGGKRVCGKTGTTDGPRDLTTVLYHTNLVVGVWAGNNNNEVTCGVRRADGDCGGAQASSSTIPLPLAHSFMTRVSGMYSPEVPSRPGNIVSTSVCLDSGLPADSSNS